MCIRDRSMTVPGESKKVSEKIAGGFTDTSLTNPYGDGKTYLEMCIRDSLSSPAMCSSLRLVAQVSTSKFTI